MANATAMANVTAVSTADDGKDEWWVNALKLVAILVLAFFSATFSGLDLGLMSLSPGQLEMFIKTGDRGDAVAKLNARRAKSILPVRRDGNLLLCTVLLGNVAVNSCLAVLLDAFLGGPAAFVITTFLVVTFGEITPQALCFRHGLAIGAKLLPILKVFMILFYIVNKPMAMILDFTFGEADHATVLDHDQMKASLEYQTGKDPALLGRRQTKLFKGVLEASSLAAKDVMIPIDKAFCLDVQSTIDAALLQAVIDSGFSWLPVVDHSLDPFGNKMPSIIGLLHVKDLLVIDPESALPVKTMLALFGRTIPTVTEDECIWSLLRTFREGYSLALVKQFVDALSCEPYWIQVGIVTADDVLGAIVQADLAEKALDMLPEEKLPRIITSGAQVADRPIGRAEALAIDAFWRSRYPQLNQGVPTESVVRFIQHDCKLQTCSRGEVIYRRGIPADFACLVLAGGLNVYAGREGFQSTSTAWDFLAVEALSFESSSSEPEWASEPDEDIVSAAATYIPDFTAHAEHGSRLLLCSRKSFRSWRDDGAVSDL